jgi:hypothetical protein
MWREMRRTATSALPDACGVAAWLDRTWLVHVVAGETWR